MENPPAKDQPIETQPLPPTDWSILRELGGPGGWRFWWPLVFWLLDALTLVFFRPDAVGEPSGILLVTSYIAVILIWVLGARPALWHGHNKMLVRSWAVIASLAVNAGAMAIGAVARVVEATVVGNENASIFITGTKEPDHTVWFGFAEQTYLYYGLPILVIVILVCWVLVGRSARKA